MRMPKESSSCGVRERRVFWIIRPGALCSLNSYGPYGKRPGVSLEKLSTHMRTSKARQFDDDATRCSNARAAAGVELCWPSAAAPVGEPSRPRRSVRRAARLDLRHGGRPPARRERGDARTFAQLEELGRHPRSDRLGRDGASISLRGFAARRAGTCFSPPTAGARREAPRCDSLPRRMGRLSRHPRKRWKHAPWAGSFIVLPARSTMRDEAWR